MSKSSAALAVVVTLAASANAVQTGKSVSVNTGITLPAVSAVKTLNVPSILPAVNVNGLGATFAVPNVEATPIAVLQQDARIQVITSAKSEDQALKPGASQAFFDNGSVKAGSVDQTPVSGSRSGFTPLPANTGSAKTAKASTGLSRLAYGSISGANGGMVWDAIKRIGRAIGSIFSIFSKKVNTPELSAEAYMAKLKTEGEQLQKLVAGAATTVAKLRLQVKEEAVKIAELSTKRDAALKAGREDIFERYDAQLEPMETTHASNKDQLAAAEASLQNAKETLAAFVQRREGEYARIQAKLGQAKAAQAKAQLDALKNSMRTGQIEEKDEFDRAVNDAIAKAEGDSEASKATGQDEIEDFERDLEKQKRKERLEQRKKELGL